MSVFNTLKNMQKLIKDGAILKLIGREQFQLKSNALITEIV